jgi:hypothetical protein
MSQGSGSRTGHAGNSADGRVAEMPQYSLLELRSDRCQEDLMTKVAHGSQRGIAELKQFCLMYTNDPKFRARVDGNRWLMTERCRLRCIFNLMRDHSTLTSSELKDGAVHFQVTVEELDHMLRTNNVIHNHEVADHGEGDQGFRRTNDQSSSSSRLLQRPGRDARRDSPTRATGASPGAGAGQRRPPSSKSPSASSSRRA